MRWALEWNPVTVKRWRRFRRLRRAWWSLWVLTVLYAVSLVAELICNNTPLVMRMDGHLFFPVVRFYPEDTFLHNGRQTRPDFKQLAHTARFASNPDNFVIFPLIPYGPTETTDPASIKLRDAITLAFHPEPRIAVVTLSKDLIIAKSDGTEFFFESSPDFLHGRSFTNYWSLSSALQTGITFRLQNVAAPSVHSRITSIGQPPRQANAWLSDFTPRPHAPETVRVTLREIDDSLPPAHGSIFMNNRLEVISSTFSPWLTLSENVRSNLTAFAAARMTGAAGEQTQVIGDTLYTIRATTSEVRWPLKPVPGHWMGIDSAGRDVLARILYGLRTSLTFGFLLVALSMALGTLIGAIQGYFGKRVDIVGQRFTEIWNALPFLYVMILIGAVYGRGFIMLLICYGIFNWIGISYYARAEFLRLRHLPFVEAARTLGLPHHTIIFRHILPNALVPLITFFPFYLVGAIGSLTALDYLGFGLPPPTPSWGELLAQAQQFRWAWWLILYPSLSLFVVMLLGVFVGEGIRNAYDPRPQTRYE